MEFINNLIDAIFINDFISTWVPVFATLMIMSFLYRDNPLYKVGENIFLGISIGYLWMEAWDTSISSFVIMPIRDMFTEFKPGDFVTIFWLLISSTMIFRFSKTKAWVSNYFFGFYFGYSAGYYIPVTVQNIMKQTTDLMKDMGQYSTFFEISKWTVIILGVFSALMFFFFSKPHKGVLGRTARVGIFTLMIFFGAAFGSTVMGRVSLFIDRALVLVSHPLESWISTGIIILFLILYFKFIYKEKEFDDEEMA
ncbi:MAG: hypothetical protein CR982_08465 [Candidatus Cloacimonadota bacterium]|nr:MAG: hypothetical protein CR982_08465 [Candidatus Cloacimonadota bacterium]PIE77887.1 MAG: hypothetical protein CSA15_10595 [Candidatus Delongbacteria bacterium]